MEKKGRSLCSKKDSTNVHMEAGEQSKYVRSEGARNSEYLFVKCKQLTYPIQGRATATGSTAFNCSQGLGTHLLGWFEFEQWEDDTTGNERYAKEYPGELHLAKAGVVDRDRERSSMLREPNLSLEEKWEEWRAWGRRGGGEVVKDGYCLCWGLNQSWRAIARVPKFTYHEHKVIHKFMYAKVYIPMASRIVWT